MEDMRKYWNILRRYKLSLAVCPLLVLVTVWSETVQPMYMADSIDQGVMKRDLGLITEKGTYMVLISLLGLAFSVVNGWLRVLLLGSVPICGQLCSERFSSCLFLIWIGLVLLP